mgnify:CR=1 FL=1
MPRDLDISLHGVCLGRRTLTVGSVHVRDGRFTEAAAPGARSVTLPDGWVITPGLVDVQVNGYAGRERGYFPMPFWLASLVGTLSGILPAGMRPVTADQVRMLRADNVVSEAAQKEGRTLAGLGITAPHAISTIVPQYLEAYRPKGQFSHYRG